MNKAALTTLITLAIALTGCAGTKGYSTFLEQNGNLRVAEPDSDLYDYKFYIKAILDFEVNTEKQEDRLLLIRGYLGATCKDVKITEEQFLPAGGMSVGVKLGTWVSKVKCLKPA